MKKEKDDPEKLEDSTFTSNEMSVSKKTFKDWFILNQINRIKNFAIVFTVLFFSTAFIFSFITDILLASYN